MLNPTKKLKNRIIKGYKEIADVLKTIINFHLNKMINHYQSCCIEYPLNQVYI